MNKNLNKGISSAKKNTKSHRSGLFEKIFFYFFRNYKGNGICFEFDDGFSRFIGDPDDSSPTIHIHDSRFFRRTILFGEIGFGEAFIFKYWDSKEVLEVLHWFIIGTKKSKSLSGKSRILIKVMNIGNKGIHWLRSNTIRKAKKNISEHYDLGNEMYELMLDKTMSYSSAIYYTKKETLEQAQINKFDKICKKINLKPEDHILEIGSGWGGFAIYVAQKYGCKITTVTISQKQFNYVKEKIDKLNLSDKIEIKLQDYRRLTGKFDKIVSIEMIEALGFKYLDTFFKKVDLLLNEGGLVLVQCITYPEAWFDRYLKNVDFIQKHIFPGADLLSTLEIMKSIHRTGDLCIYDIESLGQDYAQTLADWRKNFIDHIDKIKDQGYKERFIRKWIYYLVYCEAGFSSRYINNVQILFSRPNNPNLVHKF